MLIELSKINKGPSKSNDLFDLPEVRRQLNQAFDDAQLDAMCHDHFTDLFNDIFARGQRKDEKITLLLDHCRRDPERSQKLLNLLANSEEIKKIQLNFINREDEIKLIKRPTVPYQLIFAPTRYGKSRLIEEVRTHFQDDNWLYIYFKLDRKLSYSIYDITTNTLRKLGHDIQDDQALKLPKECARQLAHCLLEWSRNFQPRRTLLLLDEMESLHEEVAKQFLGEVIPLLHDGLREADDKYELRVILAGGYFADRGWVGSVKKIIPWSVITMSPFTFADVQRLVWDFAARTEYNLTTDIKQRIASHLMYLTGGHLGCVAEILQNFRFGWPVDDYLLGQEQKHYAQVIQPVVLDITKYIPKHLLEIFETLSVVRRFNTRLLRHFIDKGLLKWSETEYDLEDELTQTYLVNRQSGFLTDQITRRLLAIRMRNEEVKRLINISKEAIVFYEKSLQNPQVVRADIIATEILFQKLLCYSNEKMMSKKQLFENINDILAKLVSKREALGVTRSFLDLLKDDWELKFMFNYFLRDEVNQDISPYTELIDVITAFERQLRGV